MAKRCLAPYHAKPIQVPLKYRIGHDVDFVFNKGVISLARVQPCDDIRGICVRLFMNDTGWDYCRSLCSTESLFGHFLRIMLAQDIAMGYIIGNFSTHCPSRPEYFIND